MRSRQNQPFWFKTYFSFFFCPCLFLLNRVMSYRVLVSVYTHTHTYIQTFERVSTRWVTVYACSGFWSHVFSFDFAEWRDTHVQCCGVANVVVQVRRLTWWTSYAQRPDHFLTNNRFDQMHLFSYWMRLELSFYFNIFQLFQHLCFIIIAFVDDICQLWTALIVISLKFWTLNQNSLHLE